MLARGGFLLSQADKFSWAFGNHQPREGVSRLQAPRAGMQLPSSWHVLSYLHLSAAEVLHSVGMKIFIKQTRKSITRSHQMLAPWQMARLPASGKCAGLMSDSCKGALYLNEACTPHGRICGEVQGPMRLLIKAEHQSPVFRMFLEIQCCQLTQARWIHDYENESSYIWNLKNTTNWWL